MHRFQGERQRRTPVADAETLCRILCAIEWKASLKRKRAALVALMRHVGGDESIVNDCLREAADYDSDSD